MNYLLFSLKSIIIDVRKGSKYASEACHKNKQLDAPLIQDECPLFAFKWHSGEKITINAKIRRAATPLFSSHDF